MSTHTPQAPDELAPEERELEEWQEWRARRAEGVRAPYGPLALAGTHWLGEHPDGLLPDIPGRWRPAGDSVSLTRAVGLTVDGRPYAGEVLLGPDGADPAGSRVARGARRFVVLRREGEWGLRDFDPSSPARRDFPGLAVSAWDPRWSVPGTFHPYASVRTVTVPNADGRARGLGLGGELRFRLDGDEHRLQAAVEADGSLWAVFADATSGAGSFRFRFLRPGPPDARGRVRVDFNRAVLPPCALADHFLCPFPPPGNTLTAAVEAGERDLAPR